MITTAIMETTLRREAMIRPIVILATTYEVDKDVQVSSRAV